MATEQDPAAGIKRPLSNDEMIAMAILSLATPLVGGLVGGNSGAMAGAGAGLKGAGSIAEGAADEERDLKKFARTKAANADDRSARLADAITLEKVKSEGKAPKTTKNALGQVINAETGEVIDATKTPPKPATASTKSQTDKPVSTKPQDDLRKEFNRHPITIQTNKVDQSYAAIKAASPTAAGDLSMIFQFMKMLDPSSTVREGEFANAQNAAGVPDRIRNQWNKMVNGERLTGNQRAEFLTEAKGIADAQHAAHKPIREYYSGLAKRRGLSSDDVVIPAAGDAGSGAAAPAATPLSRQKAKDGNWYIEVSPGEFELDPNQEG